MICFPFRSTNSDPLQRRRYYQERKLEILKHIRDNLESRLSAVNASINTVEIQIERDN